MQTKSNSLVQTLLGLPVFHSEWVLWLLLALSVISIGLILERWVFYRMHVVDVEAIRQALTTQLERGDYAAAANVL